MTRDPRFDVLFEPVKLGPVTAPNRFYQVPHCTGMGWAWPQTLASMREVKAEGGWGVVNTEYCSIHPSSDDTPHPFCSLWDEGDVRNMARMTEGVHRHGSLAGVELWYGGVSSNFLTREIALGADSWPTAFAGWQSRRMDRDDIKQLRQWHRDAALRAKQADFDIVYVYAAHLYLVCNMLDSGMNFRDDDYGGSFENRSRLYRELVEDTREAVGDRCAIATRIEVAGSDGNRQERSRLLEMVAPLVDLFDVTVQDYRGQEMAASRFIKEASLEAEVAHVRKVTGKPVVSVGRFTSPETMLSQVRRGVLDFIGAARPSIADPFLPNKIRDGQFEDIRECIGCNICYAHDSLGAPIRCTQNPSMGEEWRRGWHPEKVTIATNPQQMLIVGAGPAGLEAAVILGKRGVPVMLAEARNELGGRVVLESRLPGLSEWARVRDWRVEQLKKLPNVEVFRASTMTAADVIDTGIANVMVATGSHWRTDGRGSSSYGPISSFADSRTASVDTVLAGNSPGGDVVVFDDEHYYMGSTLAELLVNKGCNVTYVTTSGHASSWSMHTAEDHLVNARLMSLGVTIITNTNVAALTAGGAVLKCVFSGAHRELVCDAFVPVTSREPNDQLYKDLKIAGLKSLLLVGDCKAPGIIAQAVHEGHKAATEWAVDPSALIYRRERAMVS